MTIHHRAKEIAGYITGKAAVLEGMGHRAEARELTKLADDVATGRIPHPTHPKPRPYIAGCLFPKRYIIVRTALPNPKRTTGKSANRHKRVEVYRTGMSVGAYLAATAGIGKDIFDLWWDERDGLIQVVSPEDYSETRTV